MRKTKKVMVGLVFVTFFKPFISQRWTRWKQSLPTIFPKIQVTHLYVLYCIVLTFMGPLIDIGSNGTGYYELKAVLTHIGRSSDAGHYMAWVRDGDTGRI